MDEGAEVGVAASVGVAAGVEVAMGLSKADNVGEEIGSVVARTIGVAVSVGLSGIGADVG